MQFNEIPASERIVDRDENVEPLIAADGGRLTPPATTLADFVRMIEDGQFDADVTHDLSELNADMEDLFALQGGTLKATLTLKIEMKREVEGFYTLSAEHTIKRPKQPRKRSIAWLTEDNLFTPNQPRQGALFSPRGPQPTRRVRN